MDNFKLNFLWRGRNQLLPLLYLLKDSAIAHTTPVSEKFEYATIIGHFGFVFEEDSGAEKSPDYFSKSTDFKKSSFHAKSQSRCFEIPV